MDSTFTARLYNSTEPGYRFRAELFFDHDAPDPTQEDYFESKLTVVEAGYSSTSDIGFEGFALQDALERMNEGITSAWKSRSSEHLENLVAAVNRYAALTGEEARVFLFKHRGYSQSDWATVLVEADNEDTARTDFEMWSGWARGDVYGVEIHRERYDSEFDVWYEVDAGDALWGIEGFGLNYYAALQYGVDYVAPLDLVHEEWTP